LIWINSTAGGGASIKRVLDPVESRMKATVLDRRQSSTRVAFIVLAILALSLVPLRAFCDLGWANAAQTMSGHPTGHGEGHSDLCCASIANSALVNSVAPDLSGGPSAAPLVALLVSALLLSGFLVQPSRLAGAPLPSRSYYARSARILR
jgi:hypothetical protein